MGESKDKTGKPEEAGAERVLHRLELEVAPEATAIRLLRGTIRALLTDHGMPAALVEHLILRLDEVLMNACEHGGATAENTSVELKVMLFQDRVAMEVLDRGTGTPRNQDCCNELPDDEAESGRGLYLVHHTMDEVSFHEREGGGTLVRLVKRR